MTDFEEYLKKYCKTYGISEEEAMQHALVKNVKQMYEENDNTVKTCGWKEEP